MKKQDTSRPKLLAVQLWYNSGRTKADLRALLSEGYGYTYSEAHDILKQLKPREKRI